jgi:hypothetical protein
VSESDIHVVQTAAGNIRSAINIIAELRGGQVVTEMSAAIHDAVAAVREHNKKATVTLTLVIAPASNQQLREPAITIVPEVDAKLPEAPGDATLFFVDSDGNPSRNIEKKQPDLGFRAAEQSAAGNGD